MTRCGRFGTACLSAAIAASSFTPSVAASPESADVARATASSRAAAAVFARPASDNPVVTPNATGTAYVRSAPADAGTPAGKPQPVFVQPDEAGWIAVAGAFQRQGSYELPGGAMSLGDLIERCGGLTAEASGQMRLVRGGTPTSLVDHANLRLRPGDLLIAERRQDAGANRSHAPIDCELAILGLTGRPLVVRVPAAFATVEGMLKLTGQTHLTPGDVKVLVGGRHATPGDLVGELAETSVLIFDPLEVNGEAVARHPPPTNYFSAGAATSQPVEPNRPRASITRVAAVDAPPLEAPGDEPATTSSVDQPPVPRSLANPVSSDTAPLSVNPEPPVEITVASPAANASPSNGEAGLAPLPPEMLDPPPGEPELRFPRVADRSGAIPIGRPESESHIVPLPNDVFYPVDPTPTASPQETADVTAANSEPAVTVAPIDLTDPSSAENEQEPPFADLLPTLVLGAVLGGITYLTLRWLRGRKHTAAGHKRGSTSKLKKATQDSTADAPPLRLVHPEMRPVTAPTEPATKEMPALQPVDDTPSEPVVTGTPTVSSTPTDDVLAALVADRLVRREEVVALPLSLHLHGRSAALRKQRLDDAAAAMPEPHLALAASPSVSRKTFPSANAGDVSDSLPAGTQGEPSLDTGAEAALATGTPFERALAARRQAQLRNERSSGRSA